MRMVYGWFKIFSMSPKVKGYRLLNDRLILFLLALTLFFNTSLSHAGWLIYHKPEFKGKVINAETKEPIEGAVVIAFYKKYPIISGPAGGSASIIKIKETLTDNKGEFYFPPYTTVIQPLAEEWHTNFIIYKPGYSSYRDFPGHDKFVIWALPEGLGFNHKLSETIKRRVEESWKRDFEERIKTLPEKERARIRFGRKVEYQLPIIPMKNAGERLQALDIPYFTLPDDINIRDIKWINLLEMDINFINLKEESDYMVIGLPKLRTREERLKAIPGTPAAIRPKELPLFYKLKNEERKRFKLKEVK